MSTPSNIQSDIIEFVHEDSQSYQQFLNGLERRGLSDKHFEIRVVDKKGHPWEHRITDTDRSYQINGVKGLRIHLTRGNRYFFTFFPMENSEEFSLFFTADPVGGKKGDISDSHNYEPVSIKGTPMANKFMSFSFIIRQDSTVFPTVLYYQDRNHRFMGGMIIVGSDRAKSGHHSKPHKPKENVKKDPTDQKKEHHRDVTISPKRDHRGRTHSPKRDHRGRTPSPKRDHHRNRTPSPKQENHRNRTPSPKRDHHRGRTPSPKKNYHRGRTPSPKRDYRKDSSPKRDYHRSPRRDHRKKN